jgi:hypothetical protein
MGTGIFAIGWPDFFVSFPDVMLLHVLYVIFAVFTLTSFVLLLLAFTRCHGSRLTEVGTREFGCCLHSKCLSKCLYTSYNFCRAIMF